MSKKQIEKLSEEGWELEDKEEYIVSALENLGESVAKHSEEVKAAGVGVEKSMIDLTSGVEKALQKLIRKDSSEKTIKQITSVISLSLDIFDKKQSNLVNKITVSNTEIKTLAETITRLLKEPRRFKFEVARNSIGLISEITATEIKE